MSDLTLNDLCVLKRTEDGFTHRPATVDDVVAVLVNQGGKMQDATTHELWHRGVRRVLEVKEAGRYLVYRLPDKEEE